MIRLIPEKVVFGVDDEKYVYCFRNKEGLVVATAMI
jgi:hypothetical protein